MAFVDLEKTFDSVPQKVIWWALRKICVDEWIVQLVKGMYADVQRCIRVRGSYSQESEVKVGVHQGLIFSSLLCLWPCNASSVLASPGMTSMLMTL